MSENSLNLLVFEKRILLEWWGRIQWANRDFQENHSWGESSLWHQGSGTSGIENQDLSQGMLFKKTFLSTYYSHCFKCLEYISEHNGQRSVSLGFLHSGGMRRAKELINVIISKLYSSWVVISSMGKKAKQHKENALDLLSFERFHQNDRNRGQQGQLRI